MSEGSEVANLETFTKWARSPFTIALARGAMLATPFLIGGLGWLIWLGAGDAQTRVKAVESTINAKLPVIESNVSGMSATQVARAKDSEAFQLVVTNAISDLKAGLRSANTSISDVKEDVFTTKVDVAVIKRLVTELRQKQDVALGPLGTPSPALTPTVAGSRP